MLKLNLKSNLALVGGAMVIIAGTSLAGTSVFDANQTIVGVGSSAQLETSGTGNSYAVVTVLNAFSGSGARAINCTTCPSTGPLSGLQCKQAIFPLAGDNDRAMLSMANSVWLSSRKATIYYDGCHLGFPKITRIDGTN